MNLFLATYNNYYNRRYRKHSTLAEYISAVGGQCLFLQNINFNPGDGVTTEVILGTGKGAFLN